MATSHEETHWQRACRDFVVSEALDPQCLKLLHAFADPAGIHDAELNRRDITFGALERRAEACVSVLHRRIPEALSEQLPAARRRHQQRRFLQLVAGLGGLPQREARLLRVGLITRLAEILERPQRCRSRVRDVLDFYYCHGAVLHHFEPGLPTLGQRAGQLEWHALSAGVEHSQLVGGCREGPVNINLLRVRGHRFAPLLLPQPELDFADFIRRHGASFGTSSGYILASEMDIEPPSLFGDPVGLLVRDGEVISPPVFPRTALVYDGGGLAVRRIGPVGFVISLADWRTTIGAYHQRDALAGVPVVFNRAWGERAPAAADGGLSLAILGRRVVAVGVGPLAIPKAGWVLLLPSAAGLPKVDKLLGCDVDYFGPDATLRAAAAAGPALLEGGEVKVDLAAECFTPAVPPYTFSADETLDQNLLPRMVAGLTGDGALILAAIDGRNFQRAIGMTLRQCGALLQALGCERGVNLDGGDSKRMAVAGRVVDLPGCELEWDPAATTDTSAPIRPVHSALLWFPE